MRWLINLRNLFLTVWRPRFEIKVPAPLGSGESVPPGCRWLSPHRSHRMERGKELSGASFIKALTGFMTASPSRPSCHLPHLCSQYMTLFPIFWEKWINEKGISTDSHHHIHLHQHLTCALPLCTLAQMTVHFLLSLWGHTSSNLSLFHIINFLSLLSHSQDYTSMQLNLPAWPTCHFLKFPPSFLVLSNYNLY